MRQRFIPIRKKISNPKLVLILLHALSLHACHCQSCVYYYIRLGEVSADSEGASCELGALQRERERERENVS